MEQTPIGKKKETKTLNFIWAKPAVLGEIVLGGHFLSWPFKKVFDMTKVL